MTSTLFLLVSRLQEDTASSSLHRRQIRLSLGGAGSAVIATIRFLTLIVKFRLDVVLERALVQRYGAHLAWVLLLLRQV